MSRHISGHWLAFSSTAVLLVAAVPKLGVSQALGVSQSPEKPRWVGSWAASPLIADGRWMRPVTNSTMREVVHLSNGGAQVRLRFTNELGVDPLTISNAHVALSAGGSDIKEGTDHAVTFGGAASVRLAPGAAIYSDPVALAVAPLSDVAVSFYMPAQNMRAETAHLAATQDNFIADGDQTSAVSLTQPKMVTSWYFFDGVDVPAVEGSRAIVTLGDSITDGSASTKNGNKRWPNILANRLKQEHGMENVAVLDEGIGGNRVLNEQSGPSAITRFDRDVLGQSGVKYLMILEGINDIGRLAAGRMMGPEDDITAQNLEHAIAQIADRAHEHGIKVIVATLTPYGGAGYWSERGAQAWKDYNNWIRNCGLFDGVVDFAQITADPANPDRFNPAYDSGDHLHPNDAGYNAMGSAIDLKLFK
jgi:lysophospholipase L1-like esterase